MSVTMGGSGTLLKATADAKGMWKVVLPPQQAQVTGVIVTAKSASGVVELVDVVFGEVIMCSGQVRHALLAHAALPFSHTQKS